MPIYEYICKKCGHKFEVLVYTRRQISCPQCGKNECEKTYSLFAALGTDSQITDSNKCTSCSHDHCATGD